MSAPRRRPCGTPAAYRWHRYHGEEPCGPCWEAARAHWRGHRPRQDTLIDEIAVRRAAQGDPVTLTRLERVEAARVIVAAGGTPWEIVKRLRTSGARANQLYEQITGSGFRYEAKHATRAQLRGVA
jgi:hypothetical protein